ncbi:metallophosphoesterase [Flavobacterium sp. 25HG05S-40]|uniref:metallophosphoesterase n=1 Tax=Flavobacterium sp. 25HG05S-40 TaxID=3458682 RepID=UPI004043D4F5
MKKIRILHLTDFHFSNEKKAIPNQNRLIDAMLKSLEQEKNNIDFLFFTGDLVNSGKDFKDFEDADKVLIQEVLASLNIKKDDVFICPGNHDVNRGQELDDIKDSINKIKSDKELDGYVLKQDGRSLKASLANFNNYLKFQKAFYKNDQDILDPLFTVHKRKKKDLPINITTINSAWRAIDSNTDSGNLLYPVHYLKTAFEIIKKDNALNILLLHHPLSDFKYWNQQTLEDIIFKDYHLMFSGHTHKKRDTIHVVPEIGMYSCTSPATLSLDGKSKIGYSIIEIDLESYNVKIENKLYQQDEEVFYSSTPLYGQIPISEKKQIENRFRETIRKRFNIELEKANDLFLSYSDKKEKSNFLDLFTDPVIDNNSMTHIGSKKSQSKKILLNELINSRDNQILFGKDKSGKTAILYKILLDTLNEFSINNILPIYINCKELIKSENQIDIIKTIRSFYELSTTDAEKLSQSYHIKILLDNFNENEKLILSPLNDYITKFKNASIIATAEETLLNGFSNKTINGTFFNNKFIWDIGRTQIRTLTNKWPSLSEESREILLEKIQKVFTQLNIPNNYWTVSLFIWIFEKNADATFRNNFQLIELYIDNLLDKESFVSKESIYKIDFEDFKNYLGELAHHLVVEYNSSNYIITYVDLINFTSDYKKRNRKFVIEVQSIVEIIIEKGVLRKIDDDSYTFRLNGVFEYFLAFYMKDNIEFRDEIIEDGHFYLSFGNEFEICAGFNSRDIEFANKIYKKTKEIFSPINCLYDFEKIDFHLKLIIQDKLKIDLRLPELLKDSIKPISLENQDVIFEEITGLDNKKLAEVQQKKYYEKIESNSENLEKALFILSRVFRNSKFKDIKLEDEIFEFILNSSCTLGFKLMEEIEENKLDYINDKTTEEDLMKLLTQFVPIVVQTFFYDSLVQNNLETILIDKIKELKENSKENQFKLLILYFSLIDLNLKQNHKYIDEVIEILNMGVLKQTSLIKLYIYLALKVNGNEALEDKIKKSIRSQELKIDSDKKKIGHIEQKISNASKINNPRK